MTKRVAAAVVIAIAICVGAIVTYCMLRPREILGVTDVYSTVTLQLQDNLFYDVRIPTEAKLQSTDAATIYSYDLLTVGVQDVEPSTFCKVQVGGRWVYANSKDGWLRATLAGFESNEPYAGHYNTEGTKWTDQVPNVVMSLDTELLEQLRVGMSYQFGGSDFITTQVAYGTFPVAVERALTKMETLFRQKIVTGAKDDNHLWVTSAGYTVAVVAINYNTCLVISAHGDQGRQYAARLVREALR